MRQYTKKYIYKKTLSLDKERKKTKWSISAPKAYSTVFIRLPNICNHGPCWMGSLGSCPRGLGLPHPAPLPCRVQRARLRLHSRPTTSWTFRSAPGGAGLSTFKTLLPTPHKLSRKHYSEHVSVGSLLKSVQITRADDFAL